MLSSELRSWLRPTSGTSLRRTRRPGGATVFFGALTGAGPLTGTGTAYVEGDLRPGNSAARITVGGDLVLGSLAAVEIEVGGLTAGTQHDQLAVTGQVALDGVLRVVLISGFTPQPGHVFTLLTFGSHAGAFASVQLPVVPGVQLTLETTPTALRLRATAGSKIGRAHV